MFLTVIIPTLNEASHLPDVLSDLAGPSTELRAGHADEIIVADGGSTDATESIARAHGCQWVSAPRGRGSQLAAGARAARGDILFFVHADACLPADFRSAIESSLADPGVALGAFHLSIAGDRRSYRLIERWANARSRWFDLPYGDQGFFLTRAAYDRIGGFTDLPIMEDVDLARRAKCLGRIILAPSAISVSPRRWEREGCLTASMRNLALLALFRVGIPPAKLAEWYS